MALHQNKTIQTEENHEFMSLADYETGAPGSVEVG